MFEAVAAPMAQSVDMDAAAQANPQPGPESVPQSVIFHAATGLDESAITTVQANVRKRILRAFVARGHTEPLQFDKYSGELVLTPLELINRIAQLVPPPRTGHRCGMSVVRRNHRNRARVWMLSRTGRTRIWPTNHSPTTPTISARTGEREKAGATTALG
jgi:hypothetical protein